MTRLIFDTESDGLRHEATKLHCIVTKDVDTKAVYQFYGAETIPGDHGSIELGISYLLQAEELIGHNIIRHDLPLIESLYHVQFKAHKVDTLVLSKALNADRAFPKGCPGSVVNPLTGKSSRIGPHSLAAWGYRLGRKKPEHHDWQTFSLDMLHRCKEDVEINYLTYCALLQEINACEN